MRDNGQYLHVNWIDGMKISKDLFIAQDDAIRNELYDIASVNLSKIKYGILPPVAAGQNTFNVNLSLDNQNTLRVSVLNCQAITLGGVPINISAYLKLGPNQTDAVPTATFQLTPRTEESEMWVAILVNPFEKQPAGALVIDETPPRFPFVLPVYTIKLITDIEYAQYANHPNALIIGKILGKSSGFKVDEEYIPPCMATSAYPMLLELFTDLGGFLNRFEVLCSKIIQKINVRKQKNEISDMIYFLCDRTLIQLASALNSFRWTLMHESPAYMFAAISGLARVMKNTIDLHIDSGKDALINYFNEWCDPKQGEIEKILNDTSSQRYDNNNIKENILVTATFVKFIRELFETLNKLSYIGEKKTGYIVDEKKNEPTAPVTQKRSSRFLAND